MDNDSTSNASSYKPRGPLRKIIRKPKIEFEEDPSDRNTKILIEADSSDEECPLDSDDSQSLASLDVASQSQASVAASSNVQLSSASEQQIAFVLNKVLKGHKLYDEAQVEILEEKKMQALHNTEEKKRERPEYVQNGSLQLPKPKPKKQFSHRKITERNSLNNIFQYEVKNMQEEPNLNAEVLDKEGQPKKIISKMASMGIDNQGQLNEPDFNLNFLKQWQKDIIIDDAMEQDGQPEEIAGQPTQTDEETQAAIVHISNVVKSDNTSNLEMCDQLSNLSAQQKEKLAEIPFQELIRLIQESYVHTGKYVKRPCE